MKLVYFEAFPVFTNGLYVSTLDILVQPVRNNLDLHFGLISNMFYTF